MASYKRLATLAVACAALGAYAQQPAQNTERPDYIFYFIGDGMGMGPVLAAQTYNRMVLDSDKPLTMMQFPVVGWTQTYSASSPVTDSAAAGTALSTGSKTKNGMLGMDADTLNAYSIATELQRDGYGIGLVTSVAADDATPGAFYAHVNNRKLKSEIDHQGAASGYEYIAGASYDLLSEHRDPAFARLLATENIEVKYGVAGLGDHSSRRVMLFGDSTVGHPWNVSYTIDSVAGALTLQAMTADCLNHLKRYSPDRFFMMVEGGNIDHALHANDGGAAIKEVINFDKALALAFEFYQAHPDKTLIVVTADHDTGGMALGNTTLHYKADLKLFDYQKVSKEAFSDYCKAILNSRRIYTWDDMKDYLADNLGLFGAIPVSEKRAEQLHKMFDETFEMRNSADQKTLYASFNAFAVEVFRLLNDLAGVGFTTTYHTGNPVPVFAVGVGADRFKGFNNNNLIPRLIKP